MSNGAEVRRVSNTRSLLGACAGVATVAALAFMASTAFSTDPVATNLIDMLDPIYQANWEYQETTIEGGITTIGPLVDFRRLPRWTADGAFDGGAWSITLHASLASEIQGARLRYRVNGVWTTSDEATELNGRVSPTATIVSVIGATPWPVDEIVYEAWNDLGVVHTEQIFN